MPTITVIKVPMHGFKSAILEKLKNCQNDTFEPMQFDFFSTKYLKIQREVLYTPTTTIIN